MGPQLIAILAEKKKTDTQRKGRGKGEEGSGILKASQAAGAELYWEVVSTPIARRSALFHVDRSSFSSTLCMETTTSW